MISMSYLFEYIYFNLCIIGIRQLNFKDMLPYNSMFQNIFFMNKEKLILLKPFTLQFDVIYINDDGEIFLWKAS